MVFGRRNLTTFLVGLIFAGLAIFLSRQYTGQTSTPAALPDPYANARAQLNPNGFPGLTSAARTSQNSTLQAGQTQYFQALPNPSKTANSSQLPPKNLGFIDKSKLLAHRDDAPNAAGEFKRVSLYQTDMKYPLIRTEEIMVQQGGNEAISLSRQAAVADHVLVKLDPSKTEADLRMAAQKAGGSILKPLHTAGYYIVQLPHADLDSLPHAVESLNQFKGVIAYAEADYVTSGQLTPNDNNFSRQWALQNTGQTSGKAHADIDATDAWAIVHNSPGIVVAVIDTGIDLTHPDLAANIWTNPTPGNLAGFPNDMHGWNFYGDNNNPQDDHFHGTHVSGTIGAVGNNATGVSGVTWQVKIMPLKFLSSNGSGFNTDAIDAVDYARRQGARIMSNSWGGGAYSQALKDVIDAAGNANILFVAAAGNDGKNTDVNPSYPSCYKSANILSVAATDAFDQLASFSNYGATTVNIAAPGVGIYSTFPTTATAQMTSEGFPVSYAQISGTSMATPHVSGAAALALAQNPGLTVAQLKDLLTQRSDRLQQLSGKVQTAGRLNLYAIVNSAWQPAAAQLQVTGTTLADSEGNQDGYANPGEIVSLAPGLLNVGGQNAGNITIQLISNQSSATVLSGILSGGTLQPYQPFTLGTPLRIQLAGTLADNTVLTFDLIVKAAGLADIHTPVSIIVSKPRTLTEATLNFACGEMKADPARNQVYVVDNTNHRVLAIDTDSGQIVSHASLDDGGNVATAASTGQLAVSLDGTKLYLALTAAQKIQVFSLPSLSPLTTLNVNYSPYGLACGVSGKLFASSTEYWGKIREVNATTGLDVQSFDKGSSQQFYQKALLRMSLDGTKLYVGETGIYSVGGPGYIYKFNISPSTAVLLSTYPFTSAYLNDFAIDETKNLIYTLCQGIYGVQVTDMASSAYGTVYSLGSDYGQAVALLPGDPILYGASGSSTSGRIRKFNRTDGSALGDYVVGTGGSQIKPRGTAITPNGNILYYKSGPSQSVLGLIGGSSLTVDNPPPPTSMPSLTLSSVSFSDLEGNGDSVANSGETVRLTPGIFNLGGQDATNVSMTAAVGSGATLLSPSSQSLGTIAGGKTVLGTACRIQLNSGLADGTPVNITFTLAWDSGQSKQFVNTVVVRSAPSSGVASASVQFGEIMADQYRNIVYVVDKRYLRILLFNTDSGHFDSAIPLGGLATINGAPPVPGMMAESVDGSRLYIALPDSKVIQVFSLPDMTSLAQWSYSFQPRSLACDALGRVYCSTLDSGQKVMQIDGTSGQILNQTLISSSSYDGLFSLLKRNAAGTELYSAYTNQIFRFSTTGTGAPAQISILSPGAATILDFCPDEGLARFYVASNQNNIALVPFNGSAATTWPLIDTWAVAVSYLPGRSEVLGGNGYWYAGGIRKFNRSTGATLTDITTTTNADSIPTRGMVMTPNGRTVYLKKYWTGSSSVNSVDGYLYSLGMLGGTVDLDIPTTNGISLQNLTLGSSDGYAHSGQTVTITPTFKNFTNFLLSNVSIELTSSDPMAVVQAPSVSNIGNIGSYVSFSPSPVFKLAINAAAADGKEIKLSFKLTYNDGTQQLIPYSLFVSVPLKAESQANFAIGEMIADRTRNLAYVIDNTNQRLLAIDTDAGTVAKTAKLSSSPGTGRMCLSYDGNQLYVALTAAKQIEVFTLPDLVQTDIINLDFQPAGLIAPADGKLYASNTDTWTYLRQIDPSNGKTLGQFGIQTYYSSSALKTNSDGSSIFVVELGLSGGGTIDEYKVAQDSLPVFAHGYPFNLNNTYDILIDDDYSRIYSSSGGTYGIGITEMKTGVGNITWLYDAPYGSGLCFLPGSNFVYGGSGGPYDGRIRRFNRADGRALSDISIVNGTYRMIQRALVITPNGRLLYGKVDFTGSSTAGINGYFYMLGLVGRSTLAINSTAVSPNIYLGADRTIRMSQSASLSASVSGSSGSLPITWKMDSGPQGATFSSSSSVSSSSVPDVSFSAPGTYRIRGTVKDGSLTGSDSINVTVLPDLAGVSVTATVPTAINGSAVGQLVFSRTGTPTGALSVTYTVSGTARAGIDYVSLPGLVTIPDGASSVTVPVTAIAGAINGSTVLVSISSSANYTLGVSQQAKVTVQSLSYGSWVSAKLASYGSASQAATASAANDGVSNLMKYALNLDPTLPITPGLTSGLPVIIQGSGGDGKQYLIMSYTAMTAASDIQYLVEVSSDLKTWNSGSSYTLQIREVTNGATKTIAVRDLTPLGSASARFMRLKVTQP